MEFTLTPQEQAWRAEVLEFIDQYVGTGILDVQAERHGHEGYTELERRFYDDLGRRGWNTLHWPVEHGGAGAPVMHNLILLRELEYHRLPQIDWSVASIGPLIARSGTDVNRAEWLDRIRSGEVTFGIGYSEPNAGTDLASLTTRAELDGDEWVINGQKTWNTAAHWASHEFVAVRTDPSADPPHRGISGIIVPIDAPGVEVRPLTTWGKFRVSEVFFTDVRVPKNNLVGEPNQAWKQIAGSLDHERADIGARVVGSVWRLLDDLIVYCQESVIDGQPIIERPEVAFRLAELQMELEVAMLLNYETASIMDRGAIPTIEGTMQKILASELRTKVAVTGMDFTGLAGQLDSDDADAALGGELEMDYRWAPVQRFGGGTNEVLRDVIAQAGLGLPRVGRR